MIGLGTWWLSLIGSLCCCHRLKDESSSSDDEQRTPKHTPVSTQPDPLLTQGGVSYKKTLRLTSEQLVSVVSLLAIAVGQKFCVGTGWPCWLCPAGQPAAEGRTKRRGVQRHHSVPGHLPLWGHHLPVELGWQNHHLWHRRHHYQVCRDTHLRQRLLRCAYS